MTTDPPDPDLPTAPSPDHRPGFWSRVGKGLAAAGRATGRGLTHAYGSVDPDARRQIAHLPLAGLTLLGRRHVPVQPHPDDGWRPVVFVHGLAGHRQNFGPLRAWFAVRGRRRTYSVGFVPGASFENMARHLSAFIGQVISANGLPEDAQIDVVAHSMGGLVTRLALQDPGTARRVATFVTLGTPHAGTHAARYAGTFHARELRPGSALLRSLSSQVPWRGPPPLISCWSPADMLMLPADTAVVEGAENVEMPGFSHFSYLLLPRGWRAVFGVLRRHDPGRA